MFACLLLQRLVVITVTYVVIKLCAASCLEQYVLKFNKNMSAMLAVHLHTLRQQSDFSLHKVNYTIVLN